MSKTKNQERLETLNKRLDEISQKQLQNSDIDHLKIEKEEPSQIINNNQKSNKLKTYLLRISIVVVGFLILKNLDFANLITSNEAEEPNITEKAETSKIINETLEYNFAFQSKQEAIDSKNLLSQKFIEFPINYFFLPTQSNSELEIYKIYLGPIKGLAKARQWSKMIDQESIILEF
jgi:hypothetical protein